MGNESDCPREAAIQGVKSFSRTIPESHRLNRLLVSYFWWSPLDQDIEILTRSYSVCQTLQATPPMAPLHPWVWPDIPWRRVHVDFAGPFQGRMYFIIVDAHSTWPEVIQVSSTTAQHTSDALVAVFSHYGLPHQLCQITDFSLYLMIHSVPAMKWHQSHP